MQEIITKLTSKDDKYDGHCHVKVDIYFTGVGMIDFPTEQEILTLMEEIRSESDSLQTA